MRLEHRNLLIDIIPKLLSRLDFENLVRAVGHAGVLNRLSTGLSYDQATNFIIDAASEEGWVADLIDRLAAQFPNRSEFSVIKAGLGAENPRVESPPSTRPGNRWFEDYPLDFTREETRAVERLLVATFSDSRDALYLAEIAGLDVSSLNQAAPPKFLIHEILIQARQSDRLLNLLDEVLRDNGVAAIHARLRSLMAPTKG